MQKIRRFPSALTTGLVLAGAVVLGGCVAVPGGTRYDESGYQGSYYYGNSAPVYVAPPSVYIEGGSYYQAPAYGYRRPYNTPYYEAPRPGYGQAPVLVPRPGFTPRLGDGFRRDDDGDRGQRRGDRRTEGQPPVFIDRSQGRRPDVQPPVVRMPGDRGRPSSPPNETQPQAGVPRRPLPLLRSEPLSGDRP